MEIISKSKLSNETNNGLLTPLINSYKFFLAVLQIQHRNPSRGKCPYQEPQVSHTMSVEGVRSRRGRVSTIEAAMALKAKRDETGVRKNY
jgi:hypothetical protein